MEKPKVFVDCGTALVPPQKELVALLSSLQSVGSITQVVSSELVASARQAESAAVEAFQAMHGKRNFASSLDLEFLVRLSGDRQISRALKEFAPREGRAGVVLVAAGKDSRRRLSALKKALSFHSSRDALRVDGGKFARLQSFYRLQDKAIMTIAKNNSSKERVEALKALVLERCAAVALDE
ncbi:MAG TPA: KEOPS complex subunit Cgi121 [archaeon]|nr:KEOPS complex subunit Cgi121 [archaeon]